MLLLKLVLVLVLLVLPAVAITSQLMPARLPVIKFKDTTADHAWLLIAQFAEGTFEQRFGYPSGYFHVDDKRTQQPHRLLMREAQPTGSVTDGCALTIGAAGFAGFEEGAGVGCLMMVMVWTLAAPFVLISVADRLFRRLLRSRVDVRIERAGADSVAEFRFFGLGGYSMRNRYASVFAAPILPAQFDAPPVSLARDREAQEAGVSTETEARPA